MEAFTLKVNEFTNKLNLKEMILDIESDTVEYQGKKYNYKTDMKKYETVFTETIE